MPITPFQLDVQLGSVCVHILRNRPGGLLQRKSGHTHCACVASTAIALISDCSRLRATLIQDFIPTQG